MGFFIASTSLGYALSLVLSGVAIPIGGYKLAFWLTCTGQEANRDAGDSESHPWNRAFLEERIERPLDRVYYLCAPKGLMEQIRMHLAALGVPEERVRGERW